MANAFFNDRDALFLEHGLNGQSIPLDTLESLILF